MMCSQKIRFDTKITSLCVLLVGFIENIKENLHKNILEKKMWKCVPFIKNIF